MLSREQIFNCMKFYESEETRRVYAKISEQDLKWILRRDITYAQQWRISYGEICNIINDELKRTGFNKGITVRASCHEGDRYYTEIGYELCKKRMLMKIKNLECRIVERVLLAVNKELEDIDKLLCNLEFQCARAEESLEKLYKEI